MYMNGYEFKAGQASNSVHPIFQKVE
jgi:hypothetical protein